MRRRSRCRGYTNFNPLFPYGKRPDAGQAGDAPGHFNPLFPYGKRRFRRSWRGRSCYFNPLFPYGKRQREAPQLSSSNRFQSTLPIREETPPLQAGRAAALISIHSSHTGRDVTSNLAKPYVARNFNPLFPYGKRRHLHSHSVSSIDFNPLFPYGKRP